MLLLIKTSPVLGQNGVLSLHSYTLHLIQQHLRTTPISNHISLPYSTYRNLRKGQFICIAKKEIQTLLDQECIFYDTTSAIKPQYTVNISSWMDLIQPLAPKTPLLQHILNELIQNKTTLKTVQDIEQLFSSILTTCKERAWLKKHYDLHKVTYLQKTSLSEIATKEEIFKNDIRNDFTIMIKTLRVHLSNTINDTRYTSNQE